MYKSKINDVLVPETSTCGAQASSGHSSDETSSEQCESEDSRSHTVLCTKIVSSEVHRRCC